MSQPECVNSIAEPRRFSQSAWTRLLFFSCVAFPLLLFATPAFAGSFDLVLLMDESGSMMATDPRGARKDAAELFLRLCNTKHRVEIAGFATDVRLLTDLQAMGPGAARDNALKEAGLILSSGQRTDIEKALRSARDVLMRSSQPDTTKVVLLMTDGEVDLREKGDAQKKALEDKSIENIRGPLLSKYLQDNIKIYTIAFSPGADFGLLSAVANATGGMCVRGDKEEELQRLFLRLFEEIEKPQTAPIQDGSVLIDASVREATFLIAHSAQDTGRVSLTPPGGAAINRQAAERLKNYSWFSSPSFDLITVTEPKSGRWKIDPRGKDADSRVMLITDMTLELEDFLAVSRGDEKANLLAALKSKGAIVSAPEVLQVLTVEATLTARTRTVIPLLDDGTHDDGPAGNGLFGGSYRTPATEGAYDLEIIARAPTIERRIVRSIRVAQPWFRFQLEHDALAPGESLPLKAFVSREKIASAKDAPEFIASVRQPDGQTSEIPLAQALDNLYSASFDSTKATGAYRATVTGSIKLADGTVLRDTVGPLEFMVRTAVGAAVALPVATPSPAPTPSPTVTPEPVHHETPTPAPTPETTKEKVVKEKESMSPWLLGSILGALLLIIVLLVTLLMRRSSAAKVSAPSMEPLRERAAQIREEDYDTDEVTPVEGTPLPKEEKPAPAPQPDISSVMDMAEGDGIIPPVANFNAAPTDLLEELAVEEEAPAPPAEAEKQPVAEPAPAPEPVPTPAAPTPAPVPEPVPAPAPVVASAPATPAPSLSTSEQDLLAEIMGDLGGGDTSTPAAAPAPEPAAAPAPLVKKEMNQAEMDLLAEIMGDIGGANDVSAQSPTPEIPHEKDNKSDQDAIDDILKQIEGLMK